ncbi:hypothetical protein EH138_14505 [Salmonella enterica subsp. enterica serovar Eastbourne]|uniref:Replication initiation protein n=1 Tax=Salmonella enterica subsp. enterica serovar Eastbourne TaxID=486993 RepID=A0A702B7P4_SALET|nr:hypothetical protein [Salmonella enterica subsp. enterica serovar Eastbourne]ECA1896471.1 hypothetical protein [Salmonella enterica subsp. enterica serovar Eastbourne]HAC6676364.1 hypothetical protein [Salmonella enterica subsp. enterica serovar Eastbourne]HAE5114738.1 hypothetical protein [Salmonella enterica subsp. enterica serovar Eastbourne]HAE8029058.1 hypothetical protein [Salmonella enterica subsp. enterica serovar Eastbourne]
MSKKIVSQKRVDDLRQSAHVGATSFGHPMYARLDKLVFVSELGADGNEALFARLFALKSRSRLPYRVEYHKAAKGECGDLYQSVVKIRIRDKPKEHPTALMIYFKPTSKQYGGKRSITQRGAIRVELSPQHYTADELTQLLLWLGKKGRLGKYLYRALKEAWITRVDYALDIVDMRLSDFYISLARASTGEAYDSDNGMEGIRIGSPKSTLYVASYEKVDVSDLSDEERYQATLLELDFEQYREFLRLELRLSPEKGELPLERVNEMMNLPSRLVFYSKQLREDKRLDPALASLLDQGMSIPQAWREYTPSPVVHGEFVSTDKKQAKKRFNRLLARYEVELFDAEALWDKLPEVIEQLGMLGKPALWQLDIRKKWLSKS